PVEGGRPLLTLRGHRGAVCWVSYSPDGQRLASAGEDGTVRVWDASTGNEPPPSPAQRGLPHVYRVVFSPDGKSLVSGDVSGRVHLWRVGGARVERSWNMPVPFALLFADDGRHLIVGGGGAVYVLRLARPPGGPGRPGGDFP